MLKLIAYPKCYPNTVYMIFQCNTEPTLISSGDRTLTVRHDHIILMNIL